MKGEPKARIEAEVILRPADERVSKSKQSPDAKSIRQFEASPQAVNGVSSKLCDLGFDVTATSPLTISIAGPRELFERVFQAKFTDQSDSSTSLSIPEEMRNYVDGIYIQTPPTYFNP
jgi:hypothetical protein